jgi:gluconate 2-dehydrogenase gamma chain
VSGSDLSRRDLLQVLALAPLPALGVGPEVVRRAAAGAARARAAGGFEPAFFTPHEWRTVRILADLVLPADERSGSATDAGVPEFMDFILSDQTSSQVPVRGGLAWLDTACRRRWGKPFADCGAAEQAAMLDAIAWPARAAPEVSQGVAFFNRFRDLCATGFWSSKVGVGDLRYSGNTFVAEWTGCPEAQLRKLGVEYEDGP